MFLATEQLKIVEETVLDFFQKTGEEIKIKEKETKEDILRLNLESAEPQLLIGENGQTLEEFQHLLRLILRKKLGFGFFLELDINDYKKKKTAHLEELADSAADQVLLSGGEKALPIMTAKERRIIHLALSQRQGVATESRGQEPGRWIVVKVATLSGKP